GETLCRARTPRAASAPAADVSADFAVTRAKQGDSIEVRNPAGRSRSSSFFRRRGSERCRLDAADASQCVLDGNALSQLGSSSLS
ncbi:MAG TPA: hypothetical protein VK427_24805, partial [Kofleriaceae bacterium]|nr:hypothetical protein [Kofleriaceae bacterium]